MKNFLIGILAILQIILGFVLLLSQSNTSAEVQFDIQTPRNWNNIHQAEITTNPDAPAPAPAITTTVINRVSH